MTNTNIGEESVYPASHLSNFTHYAFTVDDTPCNSMEGFLQSLKFSDPMKQIEICLLIGKKAKFKGKKKKWWLDQMLYWNGQTFNRHSKMYQDLLDRAFTALAKNPTFQKTLLDTGDKTITHSMGKSDPTKTVLTEQEFCSRLMKIRNELAANL